MQSIISEEDLGFKRDPRTCRIYAKQYDTKRTVHFELMDDVSDYEMSNVSYIYWRERFSDGTLLPPVQLQTSIIAADGRSMDISLTREMLSVPGVATCDIVFIQGNFEPVVDPDTQEIDIKNGNQLTSQTFEIFIDPTPYEDGCMAVPGEASAFDDYVTLMIAMQQAVDDEKERARAEQERIAHEGIGTYDDHEFRIGYIDTEGNQQYVEYQDSRVGRSERINALNKGGYYIDENGDLQYAKNTYVDIHGQTQTADLSDLDDMSFMTVAAQALAVAGDPTYALLSESHSHGNTGVRSGEATDNSQYYSEQSQLASASAQSYAAQAQAILDLIEDGSVDSAPQVVYDPTTGHLQYSGSAIDLSVNSTTGHLFYDIT